MPRRLPVLRFRMHAPLSRAVARRRSWLGLSGDVERIAGPATSTGPSAHRRKGHGRSDIARLTGTMPASSPEGPGSIVRAEMAKAVGLSRGAGRELRAGCFDRP